MVVIRLSRGGSKKRPFYHLVATDSRNKRDGRYIERLGYFNPVAKGAEVRLHVEMDRVQHWVDTGAQPSERVHTLLQEFKAGPEAREAELAKKKAKSDAAKAAKAAAAAKELAAQAAAEAAPAEEAPAAE